MDQIKEEIKMEADAVAKQQSASLWEGEIRVQMGGKSEDILAPVQILHKDDSRNGCRLFDWTPGKVIKIHFPLELRFNTISSFRIFNCWGNQVSNGCPWRQIEAQTEEPETIHKGILSNLLKLRINEKLFRILILWNWSAKTQSIRVRWWKCLRAGIRKRTSSF